MQQWTTQLGETFVSDGKFVIKIRKDHKWEIYNLFEWLGIGKIS